MPYLARTADAPQRATVMQLPGHLAKAASRVPDVMGKSVRNAVELFARAGVVPELKGSGSRVVRQSRRNGLARGRTERGLYSLAVGKMKLSSSARITR